MSFLSALQCASSRPPLVADLKKCVPSASCLFGMSVLQLYKVFCADFSLKKDRDVSWVHHVHRSHDGKHEQGIKDVQVHFRGEQIAVVALEIFDDTEDASNEDEDGGEVQDVELLFPWNTRREPSQVVASADLEDAGCNDEESEEGELYEEPTDDKVLAQLRLVMVSFRGRHDATTSALHEETEYVSADKDLRKPCTADNRELLPARKQNDPTEDHVDGSSEKSRAQKEQKGLHDIMAQVAWVFPGQDPAYVTDCFHCFGQIHVMPIERELLTETTDNERDHEP